MLVHETLEEVSLIEGKMKEPTKVRTILPKTTKRMAKTLKLRHHDVIKKSARFAAKKCCE